MELVTDAYQLTMAVSYLRHSMVPSTTFSLSVRRLPPARGYLVAAGIEECVDLLESFRLTDDDLDDIRTTLHLDPEPLRGLRFTGDVWGVPEGRVVLAHEPLLEVTAPLPEAQLVETLLLNRVHLQTTLATKAARCVVAAGGADLVDFGLRRVMGLDAGFQLARCCALVGFVGTSNVDAARRLRIPALGTMAHSFVEAFPDEATAFRAFADDFPDRCTFLVDTYDTVAGVRTAAEVIRERGLERAAIRLDSGDLAALARESRKVLDEAGLTHVRIVASGGLDEYAIASLVAADAPIDAYGVGTRLGVSADAPYVDAAYKLVELDGRPTMKLSTGKRSLPGAKQVFRGPDGDVLGLRDESGPEPLLVPFMEKGTRVRAAATLEASRALLQGDLARLPPEALAMAAPVAPAPSLSAALRELTARLEQRL